MNARPTIVVVIVALIGVIATALVWSNDPGEGSTAGQPGAGLVLAATAGLPVDAVERITLSRAGEPALVFVRGDEGWVQTAPFRYPMQFFSMRQLPIQATEIAVARRLDPDESAAADLGLDPPRAVLTCAWPEGQVTLEFGRRGVAGRSYLRVGGEETVYVVTGELYQRAVETNPKVWRERTVFAGLSPDPDRVAIARGPNRTVIERAGRTWMMVEPIQTRADETARHELFSALSRARSAGFILDQPDDLAKFGLAAPAAGLTVRAITRTTEGEEIVEEQQLIVGSRMGVGSEDRFGMVLGRPAVVRLPEPVLRAFFVTVTALIDPTGTGVNAADVKAIVIRWSDGELRLERDLERWLAPEYGVDVSPEKVDGLLDLLTRRRAPDIEIVDALPVGAVSITLYGFGGRPLDTVRVVMHKKGIALENGDNVLRIFPPEVRIPITAEDFGI